MNRLRNKAPQQPNPLDTANIFSRFTFWWMRDIFKLGLKGTITPNEIYKPKSSLESNKISTKFIELWTKELKTNHPSVLRVIFKIYGFPLIILGVMFSIIETSMRIIQPLCLGGLVSYFTSDQSHISKNDAYLYAGGIVLASGASILTFHPFILYLFEMGAKVRIGCSGLIYRKILNLPKSAVYDGLNGEVINLLANDTARFELALAFFHDVWKGPIEAILIGYFIYQQLGIASIVGMSFLLAFIPIQTYITKKSAELRRKTAKRTDYRMKVMNEIIHGIQVIKMYAWEMSFADMVDKIRKKEVSAIRGTSYLRATLFAFGIVTRLAIFISLLTYVYMGNVISAEKVFIVFSFFNTLNLSIVYFWPLAIGSCAEGYVSAKRIEEFLLRSETKPQCLDDKTENIDNNFGYTLPKRVYNVGGDDERKGIYMKNVTATWEAGDPQNAGICFVDLTVSERELCAIVGPVGAGKSTLLNVLIGELEIDSGDCIVNGSISYACQESWLFDGSIRSNIIFIEPFDERRYEEVIRVCGLERDFQLMPNGDKTQIGELGISLSGGQKARINLARAIYKEADIYVLDDPFSAVDVNVGQHIFKECVQEFLKDKICILVTHQLHYLKDVHHLVLMSNGRVSEQGSFTEVKEKTISSLLTGMQSSNEHDDTEETNSDHQLSTKPPSDQDPQDNNNECEEVQAIGAVKAQVYKSYFGAVDNTFYISLVAVMFVIAQGLISTVDFYISQWSNWEEQIASEKVEMSNNIEACKNTGNYSEIIFLDDYQAMASNYCTNVADAVVATDSIETEKRFRYVITYAILMAVALYAYIHRTFAFFSVCLKASTKLHDNLFRGVTRATMQFFNRNPSGRILNRFSRDINSIDIALPPALIECLSFFLEFIAMMIIVILTNYWLTIAIVAITILFYILRHIYINTARSIKRVESLSTSPIYSHINATLQGLTTVRALNAQQSLESEFYDIEDCNTGTFHLKCTTNRAFSFWLDVVCLVFIALVTFSFVIFDGENVESGNIGLVILYCINLVGMCQYGVRQTAEVESQMTSVERITEYINLPSEAALDSLPQHCPANGWPAKGEIILKDLNFRYSETSDFALRNLNLKIEANEKVGIVGRTGAGKSSIVQAIFRLADLDGEIIIDGVVSNTLGLHDLRKKISIIPQDPVLFSGTLRFNLDPFSEHSDRNLWDALEQVELKSNVCSLAGGLDCKVMDGGSNFSLGQRQLICLARAILRDNKIIICDEATANVDPETDKLIQSTIRQRFANCTVLTIAHRLHTIMDNDKILVIDAGRAVEFGSPFELLQRTDGYFKHLVSGTGKDSDGSDKKSLH